MNGGRTDPQVTDAMVKRTALPGSDGSWPVLLKEGGHYGLLGEILRTIEPHTEADPAAILLQTLVAFGNLIGPKPHFRVEADTHPLRLFTALVGETSKARKGVSWGNVSRIFHELDARWASSRIQSGLSSGEGLIWAVRDLGGDDAGDKRLLLVEEELASTLRVMGREGNTLSAIIRQAWNTGDLRVLNKNSPVHATGAHISIIGHITRNELRRYLDRTEMGNGFANRFLWVCVKRSKVLPDGGTLQDSDMEPLIRKLRAAVIFASTCAEIKRDDGAAMLWHEVYEELSDGRPGMFGAVTSRAEAQVARLAALFALLDSSPLVRRTHLRAALDVWRYCDDSCRFIFGEALGDQVADDLLLMLRHRTGATRTAIRDHFGRNRQSGEISHALDLLKQARLADSKPIETAGRPAELWFALPTRVWKPEPYEVA